MKLKRTEGETIESIRTAQHHLRSMRDYQKKGLYKSCNLRLFRQHMRYLEISINDLVDDGCDDGSVQLPLLGAKK